MVFDSVMREIKSFCKDDDTCIFVILVLIGFLLCMFFNRDNGDDGDEGFASYPFGEHGTPQGADEGETHEYGPAGADMGRVPTQAGKAADEGVKAPADPKLPQIAKAAELPGLVPRDPGEPINGRGGLDPAVKLARQGEQFPKDILPNTGGISVKGSSLDSGGPMGVPMTYYAYSPYAKFKDGESGSDLGPAFPVGEPSVPNPSGPNPSASKQIDVQPAHPGDSGTQATGVKNKMKLVLFYAPWCGHSRNMLSGYEDVISNYDNKDMNGVTLNIIKVDMAANPQGGTPYDVDIKGFPTLYTFVEENGKLISQPFSQRNKEEIILELQKRTKSYSNQ